METQGPLTQANYLTPLYINILYVPLHILSFFLRGCENDSLLVKW